MIAGVLLPISVRIVHDILPAALPPLGRLFAEAQQGQEVKDIFGTVKPPGPKALSEPGSGFSQLISFGIQGSLFIGGLLLLGYLFYGAFLYITSGGDEEKAATARNTITYAIIGMVLFFVGLAVFSVIASDVLGIVKRDAAGNLIFELPSVGN
ncbi:MAG: hypothetical protein N2691_00275 [Patescibacteria group bacterium]|nr:hypothetical protein [Patescibacteria group bacterium]